jgi:aspartyl-tRNA(Asn)/glutamyl-tRNA(Gln) amidotransferase subunit A
MVMTGKINMDEFAYNFTSETSRFGPAHNPWKRGYTPGGSSGGSGVAVAAGLCHGALGSDTGGSIRLPAAFCGIAGFKPTFGRLPTQGVLPLAWSLDHVGPMCRTAVDCRLMTEAMGLGPLVNKRSFKAVRLGIPRSPYWEKIDDETSNLTRTAVDTLARLCSGARDVTLPQLEPASGLPIFPSAYLTVIAAESFAYHSERIRTNPETFHPTIRQNIQNGATVTTAQYILARQELERLRSQNRMLFREADLLVMPGAPGPAFPLGSRADLIYLRNTAPWNLYGLPSISVPCGFTKDGMPVGLQIVGAAGEDALVLAAAELYEKEGGWTSRHPAL